MTLAATSSKQKPALLPLPPHPEGLSWPTRSWPKADLDRRIDRDKLAHLLDRAFGDTEPDDLERTNAVVIVLHGAIVAERYRSDVDPIAPSSPGRWQRASSVA